MSIWVCLPVPAFFLSEKKSTPKQFRAAIKLNNVKFKVAKVSGGSDIRMVYQGK